MKYNYQFLKNSAGTNGFRAQSNKQAGQLRCTEKQMNVFLV